ncbi:MAG: hypothetical protein WC517_00145 [Patescibacteria group bacterium]
MSRDSGNTRSDISTEGEKIALYLEKEAGLDEPRSGDIRGLAVSGTILN